MGAGSCAGEAVPRLLASQPGSLALEVDDARRAQAVLAGLGRPARMLDGRRLEVAAIDAQGGAPLHAALVGAGVALYQSVHRRPTLEQWFLELTTTDANKERHAARDTVPA
ncbi:hypothetical protein [Massilia sp. Dwa41.01b]|uniref:hypothetical protein n=1 Tax=Massilia sp. Dwa41.01b TaxID=2709302 RepID=UPI001E606BC5|nr:hypothetical protein [Massilia sp. Dwa41.01b]